MRPAFPDDLFTGPTVEIPSGLAADSLHNLAGQADYLRRVAAWLREQRQVTRAEALHLAGNCDTAAARLEQTYTALDFGRVRPGDDNATEH